MSINKQKVVWLSLLLTASIAVSLLSSCKFKNYEDRSREEAKGYADELIEQIIQADKNHSDFELLVINEYQYYLVAVVKNYAIPDGWEPVGGLTSESIGRDSYYHRYMQTIRKVDKTKHLYRDEHGVVTIGRRK